METTIKKALLLTLATTSLTGVAQAKEKLPLQTRAAMDNVRIVGGGETTPFAYPFMGSLQVFNGEKFVHYCGSSLIAPNKVLTAAHCVEGWSASDFAVKFGGHDLTDESQGQAYEVTDIVMHEGYKDEYDYNNDIAILTLANPVEGITPIELADDELKRSYVAGENFRVMGWGALHAGGPSPDKLHEVDVAYIPNEVCNDAKHYDGRISDSMLCAGFDEGGKDSCQGDSGGPLIVNRNNRWIQVGVVSWGFGCASPNRPGVYADVAFLNTWANRNQQYAGFEPGQFTIADKPNATVSVSLYNKSASSVEVAGIQLSEDSAGAAVASENCTATVLEPGQHCEVSVATSDSSSAGEFTVSAELANQAVHSRGYTYSYEKIPASRVIDAHMSSEPVVQWYTGGDAPWFVSEDVAEDNTRTPLLISGDISDREENPNLQDASQKSILLAEIDHGLALGFDFEYLLSSEQSYDFFNVYINGEQVLRKSGLADKYEKTSFDLNKGSNTVVFEYIKDSSVSEGDDNIVLKAFDVKMRDNLSPAIKLAQTNLSVRSGMGIALDATGTGDPDGDNYAVAWAEMSAPEVVLSTAETFTPVAPVVSETTTQTYEVTATDEFGAASKQRVTVTIDENKQPVIKVAEANIEVRGGLEFTLDASGTADPEGDTLSYTWINRSGDSTAPVGETAVVKLKADEAQVGKTLVYEVVAQDEFGAKAGQLVTVAVAKNNAPQVVLTAGSTLVASGQNIELSASASVDPEGDELTFNWEQVSGTSVNVSGSGAQMSVAAPTVDQNEVLEFAVTVTDAFGASSTENIKVTVKQPEKDSGSFGSFALLFMSLVLFTRRMKK
ncbi:trypsin-like serine protease [Pseudoalteromonas sp. DL2-H2.2]|uniref:serine protease n=1 Tax=Pseudoalteromonas sp. DL2-H2.2 TaxID=2908889 RepID=UPI001F2DF523|nr:serine protease [Pseudoalteromonas sp. DL2-H2.2]MCF2910451.1 trypsin-like serine protease [Pseudoalteromonas sp. DL2-H2.2]